MKFQKSISFPNPPLLRRRQFVAGMSALAGFPAVHAQSEGRIVLGQSAPLTGPSAQLGIQFLAGAKLAFDQVNAQGGMGQRRIEIRTLDDGYEPDRCAENTRRFIADDVFALFGYIGTPTSLAALPLFTQARVPFFAPLTGAMALRQPFNRLIFHVRASYDDETELIVRQLINQGMSRIGVFYQDDSYGQAGLNGVTKALAARQRQVAAVGVVERNSNDVRAAVERFASAWPHAIVQISTYGASTAFVRAARKAGYGGLFLNVSFVGTQALADELGRDGAGIEVSQVMFSPYWRTRSITLEFRDAIAKAGGKTQANYSSMEGYVAARVFIEGLRNARAQQGGKITRETLTTGLESMNGQIGGFPMAFSEINHEGSHFVEMSMLTGNGRVQT